MKNNKIKIVLFTLLLLFAVMIGMVLINSSNHKKYQQQLNLGNHFLGEMDYESAIAAFHGAIEIDSKAYEAFLGITQAYIGLEEYTSAVSSMEQVFVLTQNDFIKISLENIRNTTNTEDIKKELENAVAYLKSNDISSYPIFTNNNIGTDSANSNTVPDASTNNIVPGNVTETITPQMNENIGTSSDNIYHTGNQNTSTQSFNYTASEFTFMGYPVNEDHFSEWKSALGFPENNDSGLNHTLLPGNSISAYMSYEDDSEYDTPSEDITLTGFHALHLLDESEIPIIDWAYRAGQGIPYYFLFGTVSGSETWQSSIAANVGTPIPLGSTFEEVISILGCPQIPALNSDMVTVYGEWQNPIAYISYYSSEGMWPSYGDSSLSITSTVNNDQFNIYFRNNIVSAIDVWSHG